MASGRFTLDNAYNSSSANCISAYVDWSSKNTAGNSHAIVMKLYAARTDWTGSTAIQYSAPGGGGWVRTYTNPSLVFNGGNHIHICTVETTVTSDSSGIALFTGAEFYAGFVSSSYGTRRMSGTISKLQLDKPSVRVIVNNPDGIEVHTDKSVYSVGEQITFTVEIINTKKYSGYYISDISGATLVSGTTYTVAGDITINIGGYLRTYNLSLTLGSGVSATVSVSAPNGALWQTYNKTAANALPYSYIATVSIAIAHGYELVSFTINGVPYEQTVNPVITIVGDMVVEITTKASGVVYIKGETGMDKYQVYIYTQDGWHLYRPMIYTDSGWGICN